MWEFFLMREDVRHVCPDPTPNHINGPDFSEPALQSKKKGNCKQLKQEVKWKKSHWNFTSPHSLGCFSIISYTKGSQTKKQQLKWLCRTYQSTTDKLGTWMCPVLLSFPPLCCPLSVWKQQIRVKARHSRRSRPKLHLLVVSLWPTFYL